MYSVMSEVAVLAVAEDKKVFDAEVVQQVPVRRAVSNYMFQLHQGRNKPSHTN